MKHFFVLCFFLLSCVFLKAQKPNQTRQSGWQQRVDYIISVKLNDVNHTLSADEKLIYTNNSPNSLIEIYMHLWPNAYKNNETAFAKQVLENGKTGFYYADEEDRGYIDSLDFRINGKQVKWSLTDDIDICKITLNEPLEPGKSIEITTPFRVKLPKVFSRAGHEDQLYCVTQWYPKPAVYDVNGWNPMPYLDQGEFYSEFGKFDVSITVPENYVVAATGNLQNQDEIEWLRKKSESRFSGDNPCNKANVPESSSRYKTLRYVQDNVHDFAWFADKRFQVERSEVVLSDGRHVTTWLYEICPRKSAVHWIDTAVIFYSEHVGIYPYDHASAVVTPLKAGGGMEYPTITNVGAAGKQVIVHEVGHNWFYGILGSNERLYPWMDESFNTYYETRSNNGESAIELHRSFWKSIKDPKYKGKLDESILGSPLNMLALLYEMSARENEDQQGNLASEEYTNFNYGSIIYGKNPKSFFYLQAYLGDTLFDNMMKAYYQKWKFKHPLPDDFFDHAKQYTGEDLSWFKNDVLGSQAKQDWKISSVKKYDDHITVKIKNKADFAGPVPVHTLLENAVTSTTWIVTGSKGDTTITLPEVPVNRIRIDAYERTNDLYRSNNTIRTNGIFRRTEPVSFKFLADFESPYENRIYFSPVFGMNLYNKSMLGLAFYNSLIPRQKTEYLIVPMYAFGTKDLAGHAELDRHFITRGWFNNITAGLGASRFASEYFTVPKTYEKIAPYIQFDFNKSDKRISPDQYVKLRYVWVNEQDRTREVFANPEKAVGYAVADYHLARNRKINPYSVGVNYQVGFTSQTFQKISAEAEYFFSYNAPKKGFRARLFSGAFLQKTADDRVKFRGMGHTGQFDYLFDQSQFGRGEGSFSNSVFAQQLMPDGTQFSVIDVPAVTDSWITSLNLATTIPGIFPVQLYADLLYIDEMINKVDGNSNTTTVTYTPTLYYTGGVRVAFFSDILIVNFPVFASQNIIDIWKPANTALDPVPYGKKISFMFNLNKLNPVKGIRNIQF